jgi:hypothetical protein
MTIHGMIIRGSGVNCQIIGFSLLPFALRGGVGGRVKRLFGDE